MTGPTDKYDAPLKFAALGQRRFHVMAKPTGSRCNLDCAYCFYLSKEKLAEGPGSGDMDRDFASMAKRTASEQQDHEKSMLKMYREHYKAKEAERKRKPAPMIKSITILRNPQAS